MRILLVRNDKIGDFMLAWSAFRLIKEHLPHAEVFALVPRYTLPLAELCPWIDRTIVDPGADAGIRRLAALLRRERFDAVVTLFSTPRIGAACFLARIPYRLAPATKWAQIFYRARETQRRSRSEKPEWEYNLDLARRFLRDHGQASPRLPTAPYLQFPAQETEALRRAFCAGHGIDPNARLVFVHPGSGGSAVNLSIEQYAGLLKALHSPHPLAFVLTAGPGEENQARELGQRLKPLPYAQFVSSEGLAAFARHIAFADLWISGSTGPLHIAGALDVPTAAFYPRHRSATPLRWQTLNSPQRRLAFTPPEPAGERDMRAVDLETAAALISERFLH